MQEWAIRDVARATGLTSRALRHYEQIGLLLPSRVASNGFRFYGDAELSRLYRILSLRALGLSLAAIRQVLENDTTLEEAIRSHLRLLREERDRTIKQIATVEQILRAVQEGQEMSIDEVYAGIDQTRYEDEVRNRWGDDAWERSASRRDAMDPAEKQADLQKSVDVNGALRAAAESGLDPASASFQELVGEHYEWVAEQWGGVRPSLEAYEGLAAMYVADLRFAAAYGGQENAKIIRQAIRIWSGAHLDGAGTTDNAGGCS